MLSLSASSRFFAALLFLVSVFLWGGAVLSPLANEHTFDGPAELPRIRLRTAMVDTPAPSKVFSVRQNDNLQSAIDNAKCGDTLRLEAGGTFRGIFRLPNKPCDDAHWIIIRTSAPDKNLPPEGTRITPCYSGVASLPGRPDFHCTTTNVETTKVEFNGKGGFGPIALLPGANHYRLLGLEITRSADPAASVSNLLSVQAAQQGNTANHIVIDRVWLHGTAQGETTRGVQLTGTTHVAIIDSYFSDFHCVAATGSCTDAQAVGGGIGDSPGGPYKIVNNFLEASGENILFGGGPGTSTPVDIEIRHNHLFKPMIWKRGQPGFVGGTSGNPFMVKNHFELKNAQRVLFEGNVLENNWGGFSQAGFSILLTPKNQNNKCPACRVTDITIRYNTVSHVGSALQIANDLSDMKGPATAGERYSIHDLLVDDIDAGVYQGSGVFALVISVTPPLKDVHIDHVTAFPKRDLISFLNRRTDPQIENFSVTNSVLAATPRQISSAGGGPVNCAFKAEQLQPEGVLKSCVRNSVFSHNVIVGGKGQWPQDNTVVQQWDPVRSERSAAKERKRIDPGTDSKNAGADIQAVERAIEGVR